jgi:hypothetical protein
MTSLEELIGKDGALNLGEEFVIRPGFMDEDEANSVYWYGQVYYVEDTMTTESSTGQARLAVMRYMNGTLSPDPKDQALELAEHLYRLVCVIDQRSYEAEITAWSYQKHWETTIFRTVVLAFLTMASVLIITRWV